MTEAQGLPPPYPPLSTLPDMHLGDSTIDGIMDEVTLPSFNMLLRRLWTFRPNVQ